MRNLFSLGKAGVNALRAAFAAEHHMPNLPSETDGGGPLSPPRAPRRAKHHAYLVAVRRRREAARVYAVLVPTREEALAIVSSAAVEGSRVTLVGKLSGRLARSLKLKPGAMQLV